MVLGILMVRQYKSLSLYWYMIFMFLFFTRTLDLEQLGKKYNPILQAISWTECYVPDIMECKGS
jgi:hypothetical protein